MEEFVEFLKVAKSSVTFKGIAEKKL